MQMKGQSVLSELHTWDSQPGALGHHDPGLTCWWTTHAPALSTLLQPQVTPPRFPSGDAHSSPVPRPASGSHISESSSFCALTQHGHCVSMIPSQLCGAAGPQPMPPSVGAPLLFHPCLPLNCPATAAGGSHLHFKEKQTVLGSEMVFFQDPQEHGGVG